VVSSLIDLEMNPQRSRIRHQFPHGDGQSTQLSKIKMVPATRWLPGLNTFRKAVV
jgi:hypothetical protein